MQKFLLVLIFCLCLIFTMQADEERGKESVEETTTPLGLLKHPGDNDFDLQWDNFDSGDIIADDVCGLITTDAANDLDNDGFAEIILNDEDGITYVFENTGDNNFVLRWTANDSSNTSQFYAPVVITDMDGDNLPEIAVGFYDSGNLHFYEWDGVNGSDNYVSVHVMTFPSQDIRALAVDNLDSDINQELVVLAEDTCYVYESDASFNFTLELKATGLAPHSATSVITGDLNNNGQKEIIFGYWSYMAIYIYENTAEDTYQYVFPAGVEFQLDQSELGTPYQMVLTDFDNDGYPELYSGDSNGKLIVMEMQSQVWDTSQTNMPHVILLDKAEDDINGLIAGDIDEDNNPDLYFVSDDNHVFNWEFNGGDFFDPLNYTEYDIGELNGANAEEIAYGSDLDGDGEKDFVVGYEGTNSFPLLYFLEHHVIPAVPALNLSRNDIYFDHVWTLAELDTEIVTLENIGTVNMIVDSIVSSDPAFTSYLANTTVTALGSEDLEIYFTALDQTIHDSAYYVIYSNSSTSPDTLNVYGDSRARPLLYINEFQPKGTEWVEIYNMDTNPLDLTDIGITTGRNTYTPAAQFGDPVMSEIEYFQLDADWGPITSIAAGDLVTSFTTGLSLNNSQDWIYIIFKDSTVIDGLGYGGVGPCPLLYNFGGDSVTAGSAARVAYAGNVATDWTADFDATPGLPNDAPAPALGSSIIINEVDYDENFDGQWEYVEFFNPTGSDITMNGWRFTDGDDIFVISGLTVPANGLAVWHDSTSLSIARGDVGYIFDDTGVRIDQVGFMDLNPVTEKAVGTVQRVPDGAGPNDGYDFWSSGGDVTWFDNAPTIGAFNSLTFVIFTAQIGGDSNYRSFWINGSWDSSGVYDPNWTGPMLELKDDGIWPDTSASDSIFSGVVQLLSGSTYNWWVGSENDLGSFLEDGAAVTPDTSIFNYSTTCLVDPGDAGFNQWTIGAAGDSINGWINSEDNLSRNGWEWTGNFTLPAGPMEFKFVVMHSWEASYGDGGIGGAGGNYMYNVPAPGDYTITFNDSTNTYTITEVVDEQLFTITTPELTTAVTNEGTIGMLNDNGGSPGFTWFGSNLLYEGALMFGKSPDHVVDGVRVNIGGSQANLDADFQFITNMNIIDDNPDSTVVETVFDDSRANLPPLADDGPNLPIGLEINHTTYAYTDSNNSGYVIYKLELTNMSGSQLDGIVAGAYFDWDIGDYLVNTGQVDFNSVQIPGINGGNVFDAEFTYIWNSVSPSLGYIGAVPLSQNYFLASRVSDQRSEIYSGQMTEVHKFEYISLRRGNDPYGPGGIDDDKGIFVGLGGGTGGAGTVPDTGYTIPAGGTVTVGFAIVGGNDLADFVSNGTAAMHKWVELGNNITIFEFVTGIEEEMFAIPSEFALHQNYPNPFNPSTTIKYDLKQNTDVSLVVYDMLGREVKTVVNGNQTAGYKKVVWNGTNNSGQKVATGVYIYKLVAGDFVKTRKMVLMK